MSFVNRLSLGTIAVFLMGTAFHFMVGWLGSSAPAALFFPANESVAEHLKMLSTAAVLWMAADFFIAGRATRRRFFPARALSLPAVLILILVVHYFLKGAFGFEHVLADIATFFAACLLYQYWAMKLEQNEAFPMPPAAVGVAILVAIVALFAVFTAYPPGVPMYRVE